VFYTYLDEFQRRFRRKPAAPRHAGRVDVDAPRPAEAIPRG